MKLIRFGEPGKESPGIISEDGRRLDVSSFGEDYDGNFFSSNGLSRLSIWLSKNSDALPEIKSDVRLGPPVCRPEKIVCIGFNYKDHACETGRQIPPEPIFFLKSTSALTGPNDDLILPRNSEKTDWEVELAVVINGRISYVEKNEAMQHIAGFALFNDYSEREFQFNRGGQYVKGKSADTFAPIGPFLVTPDEIQDYLNLDMWLSVNGEIKQKSNTSNMFYDIPTLISSVSQYMSLMPGDIFCTGTPSGVGHGMRPPEYLNKGDIVKYGIDGLGEASQQVVTLDDSRRK